MSQDYNFLHSSLNDDNSTSLKTINSSEYKILLVEDDLSFGEIVKKFLSKFFDIEIEHFAHPNDLLTYLDVNPSLKFCMVTDISFGENSTDGLFLIDLLKDKNFNSFNIVMTGFASIDTAISATKKGAFQYLTKPFELIFLKDTILKGFKEHFGINSPLILKNSERDLLKEANSDNKIKLEMPKAEDLFCGMIGRGELMKRVFSRIEKVSNSSSTVLITGNSGTGKELIAKSLHKLSPRSKAPMITVNCGAIPVDLLESELFGHVKGAFTGAIHDRAGRFEQANHGTIFLDEIGDMSLVLQVKLLRVLQAREIERVGGNTTIPLDVRVITATHRNLEELVKQGLFREDLFYRLNVIPVSVPSLCERKDDISLLISFFLNRFVSADGRNNITFSDNALKALLSYNWPGNVRELENLIERLIILTGGGVIGLEDLPTRILAHLPKYKNEKMKRQILLPEDGIHLKDFLMNIEESLISQALKATGGNKKQASLLLHMNRTTLIEKLKKKSFSNPHSF